MDFYSDTRLRGCGSKSGLADHKPKCVGLSAIAFVFAVVAAEAAGQQPNRVYRLGYLTMQDAARESSRVEAIRRALQDLGYVDGQNLQFEFRYAAGKPERAPELAAKLVRLKVDIIVVSGGTGPIQAAQKATKTIPIVMEINADPVETGLVQSLARPGGNLTGLTTLSRELKEDPSQFHFVGMRT